jgi:hypothetical protein
MDAFGGAGMKWPQLTDLGGQEDFVEYHLFSNQALRETDNGTIGFDLVVGPIRDLSMSAISIDSCWK